MAQRSVSLPSTDSFLLRNLRAGLIKAASRKITLIPMLYLLFVVFLGVFGPDIAPYGAQETVYAADGSIPKAAGPSLAYPLGTTDLGYDVLSRVIIGARPTAIAGVIGGLMIISIGMTIGVAAGYQGGRTDSVLMRLTDIVYSLPLVPFALVLVGLFGISFLASVVVVGLVLWRGNARVLRSQVLQIKERPYVLAARAAGAGPGHIIVRHIIPNIAAMAFLFFAIGIGYTIIIQASLSFLGVSDPFVPSWGVLLRNAYRSGYMSRQPLWSLAPGLLISFTVVSTFLLGRELETSGDEDMALAQGGG